MSYVSKVGKFVSIADHAVHDVFVGKDVVNIVLEHEGKKISTRILVGMTDWNGEQPHIGDTIEVGWDYHNCEVHIIERGAYRQPMPKDIPVTGKRSFALDDILDSFLGDE